MCSYSTIIFSFTSNMNVSTSSRISAFDNGSPFIDDLSRMSSNGIFLLIPNSFGFISSIKLECLRSSCLLDSITESVKLCNVLRLLSNLRLCSLAKSANNKSLRCHILANRYEITSVILKEMKIIFIYCIIKKILFIVLYLLYSATAFT